MQWEDRLVVDPEVMTGKPVVRGTRLPVDLIVDLLASGTSEVELLRNYPRLTLDDIRACLAYAAEAVRLYRPVPFHA